MWEIFWLAVGLLIGWNLLPQPLWVKALWEKMMSKIFDKKE